MSTFTYECDSDVFPSEFHTERLKFKKISYEVMDVRTLYEYYSPKNNTEYEFAPFMPHTSVMDTKNWVDKSIKKFENSESAGYFIFDKEDNFIGTTSFDPKWDKNIAESGIFLFRDYWGNGYSTERGEIMLELAFEEMNFEWWISRCHPDNVGSARAIEKYVVSNGGKRVGVLPNQSVGFTTNNNQDDVLYFKISQKDYKS